MIEIFISYAREDEQRIRSLATALEECGWTVFWDRTVPVGQTWRDYIGRAITDARCVIVAWSHHSISSQWVIEEADEGMRKGILVPVLLDSVIQPLGFRQLQAADLTEWHPGKQSFNFDKLVNDIQERLEGISNRAERPPLASGVESVVGNSEVRSGTNRLRYGIFALVSSIVTALIIFMFLHKPLAPPQLETPPPQSRNNVKWGYAALSTPVKVRISKIDDRGTLIVNSKTAQVTSYPNDSGWQDITDYFTNGSNEMVFEIFNGSYGGWSGRLQIQAGSQLFDQTFERNACPCNGTAFRIRLTLGVRSDGSIASLVSGNPDYL